MTSHLRKGLYGLALLACVATLAMPGGLVALGLRLVTSGVAIGAIWNGLSTYRPKRPLRSHALHPDPWALVAIGIAFREFGEIARYLTHETSATSGGVLVSTFSLLFVVITGFALVEMLHQRFGDRAWDHCIEAVIAAGTISMGTWVTFIEPVLRHHHLGVGSGVQSAVIVTVGLVLAMFSLHLVTSFEHRQPAFTSLALSQLIPVGASVLAFYGDATHGQVATNFAVALPILSLAFIGSAAMDPSMALYEEPSGPAGARLGRLRLTNVIVPILAGPIILTLAITDVVKISSGAFMVYNISLSTLVVGHLIEMVQARASSTHWASHDKLTGLPNRALFRERTAQALERARKMGTSVSVIYLDLDRFKHINDSMGHEAGDQLLEQVARRILACVDAGDTVARLGGDEFAILLPFTDNDEIPRKLARRMLKSFSTPFNLKPRPVFMSPSVGIAVSEGSVSLETLLTQADTAMYRAKESGRNNFAVWSQEMNEASKQRLMLETHLHSAVTNDELRLVYQPKVELMTGRIVGCEALIRWHHPKLGVISPAVFIHLAEESGLINQIGEWVLNTACRQARVWYEAGHTDLTMAVNLSSRQFQNQKVADLVSAVLRKTNLSPHLLELELTESVAMSGDDRTLSTLHELRQMGVKTSIDDFGTGYSNLSYLSRFPIDNLKIDKSFVDQIDVSGGDSAIVVAIIAMAHGLGLNVVAEGVERPEQAAFLARHHCDELQGFLFSRALPPSEFEGLLMLEHIQFGKDKRNTPPPPPPVRAKRTPEAAIDAPRRIEREMPERERLESAEADAFDPMSDALNAPADEENAEEPKTEPTTPAPFDPYASA